MYFVFIIMRILLLLFKKSLRDALSLFLFLLKIFILLILKRNYLILLLIISLRY